MLPPQDGTLNGVRVPSFTGHSFFETLISASIHEMPRDASLKLDTQTGPSSEWLWPKKWPDSITKTRTDVAERDHVARKRVEKGLTECQSGIDFYQEELKRSQERKTQPKGQELSSEVSQEFVAVVAHKRIITEAVRQGTLQAKSFGEIDDAIQEGKRLYGAWMEDHEHQSAAKGANKEGKVEQIERNVRSSFGQMSHSFVEWNDPKIQEHILTGSPEDQRAITVGQIIKATRETEGEAVSNSEAERDIRMRNNDLTTVGMNYKSSIKSLDESIADEESTMRDLKGRGRQASEYYNWTERSSYNHREEIERIRKDLKETKIHITIAQMVENLGLKQGKSYSEIKAEIIHGEKLLADERAGKHEEGDSTEKVGFIDWENPFMREQILGQSIEVTDLQVMTPEGFKTVGRASRPNDKGINYVLFNNAGKTHMQIELSKDPQNTVKRGAFERLFATPGKPILIGEVDSDTDSLTSTIARFRQRFVPRYAGSITHSNIDFSDLD